MDAMDTTEAKILAMVGLGAGSLLVGMAPVCARASSTSHSLIRSCLLCFGAGVLLATSILHMLPEARETIPEYAEVAFCGGFFLIYLIDEIVHCVFGDGEDSQQSRLTQSQQSHQSRHSQVPVYLPYGSTESTNLLPRHHHHHHPEPAAGSCHTPEQEPCSRASAGKGGLLIALSAHSLLEGLAIGLENVSSKVILLLGAVASHKFVVAFCLGAEWTTSNSVTLCRHFLAILIFSLGSVAGIGVGMLIEGTNYDWSNTVLGLMQALAGGTLLYVTLSEVLPRERAQWHRLISSAGLIQFTFTVIGFLTMYFINKYLDAEHSIAGVN